MTCIEWICKKKICFMKINGNNNIILKNENVFKK